MLTIIVNLMDSSIELKRSKLVEKLIMVDIILQVRVFIKVRNFLSAISCTCFN